MMIDSDNYDQKLQKLEIDGVAYSEVFRERMNELIYMEKKKRKQFDGIYYEQGISKQAFDTFWDTVRDYFQ